MRFNEMKLGDISHVTKLAGFEFTKYFEYDDSGEIIAIRALNVKNGTLDLTEIKRISKKISENLTRSKLYKNDIILTYTGANLGEVAFIYENDKYHLAPNVSKLTVNIEVDPYFVFCFLRSDRFRQQISNYSVGSSQPTIPMNTIRELSIPIPDRETQKRIVNIIYPIDKKIELNRQMNQTLESMARTIFKSWFVDFDPVYAKMIGRDYPLPTEIMDLFPDELEESEMGLIPKGWKVSEIGNIAQIIDCLHSKKPDRVEEKTGNILLQLSNICENGLLDLSDIFWINDIDYKKWISRIEVTEGVSVITNVGRVGAAARIPKGLKAALGRNMTAINLDSQFPYNIFLILLLKSNFMKKEIQNNTDTGTILDSLNVKNIPKLSFVKPPNKITEIFENFINPIWNKMDLNLNLINQLKQNRDVLLPKFINGELI